MTNPPDTQKRTLYVFMDESGDMTFAAKGTQYFLVTAVYTSDPCESAQKMQALKYELLAAGSEDLEFHATQNSYGTRQRVLECIADMTNIRAHTLFIDKGYTHPSKQDAVKLFTIFGTAMGKWLASVVAHDYDQVIMIFDSVLTGKQQGAFKAAVKPKLKEMKVSFRLLFHPVKSDLNGQIADYYSWIAFRALESKDLAPATKLNDTTWTKFNLFRMGHTVYWKK
ncbi:DUF3800 domain-containing protein [Rhodococcus sp. UNC23MFCrub1.1]|uniref:DUF3800 domain-containing protein n=1 Tax=Rhodococcus sp. UNC23MFCrub1.1 TaxID=1449068 RepID=UPI00047FE7FB|nr:DUF3800 domain-containing protein [Rhodococcus sp. UNC23MFCrub1.1]